MVHRLGFCCFGWCRGFFGWFFFCLLVFVLRFFHDTLKGSYLSRNGICLVWCAITFRDSTVNMLLLPHSPLGFLQIMLFVFQTEHLSHFSTSPENSKGPLTVNICSICYSIAIPLETFFLKKKKKRHLHFCLTPSTMSLKQVQN